VTGSHDPEIGTSAYQFRHQAGLSDQRLIPTQISLLAPV